MEQPFLRSTSGANYRDMDIDMDGLGNEFVAARTGKHSRLDSPVTDGGGDTEVEDEDEDVRDKRVRGCEPGVRLCTSPELTELSPRYA